MNPSFEVSRFRPLNSRLLLVMVFGVVLTAFVVLPRVRSEESPPLYAAGDERDKLAYVSQDDRLMLYDPQNRSETLLLEDVSDFELSQDGRVAYKRLDRLDTDIYVFDPGIPESEPINITQNRAVNNYPASWSPDGKYLAYIEYQEQSGDASLYVWDGETHINIMPDEPLDSAEWFSVNWSRDGRLAFTVTHGWTNRDLPDETYVWDGKTTANLIYNPGAWDGWVVWNHKGQLLFSSAQRDEIITYVWDGVSYRDGVPDEASFIRVAPELQPTNANWTSDGLISITLYPDPPATTGKEIVLWDLNQQAVVNRFSVSSDNATSWLADGERVIMSVHLASGIPSFYLDVETTDGESVFDIHTGEYAWSSTGYLAYCGIEDGMSRLLSLWDGQESWVVAEVSYKPAQWQSRPRSFSCNNG